MLGVEEYIYYRRVSNVSYIGNHSIAFENIQLTENTTGIYLKATQKFIQTTQNTLSSMEMHKEPLRTL